MKTNHQRGYKDNEDKRTEYTTLSIYEESPDGEIIHATATGPGVDHCCGKHGAARDRAGAKKYVHSRRRRRTRDWLKQQLSELSPS